MEHRKEQNLRGSKHHNNSERYKEERKINNYIGGIRPNSEDPIICSLANNAAIWMAFRTPGLQLVKYLFSEFTRNIEYK